MNYDGDSRQGLSGIAAEKCSTASQAGDSRTPLGVPAPTKGNQRRIMSSRDASRPANGAADCHPLFIGRCAPSNKRMQRTPAASNKLDSACAAYPQRR